MGKESKKTFMVFGSFSGSNAGDVAVLDSLIGRLEALFPKSKYYIPTTTPAFFDNNECLKKYDIKPITMERRKCAHGFFSLPLLIKIRKCDAVFTTANMFFDRYLFSPYRNFIFSLLPALLFYRIFRRKAKIIATSVSITSPTSLLGKMVLRKVLRLHDIVTLRDSNSELVASRLSKKIQLVGHYPDLTIGKHLENGTQEQLPVIKRQDRKLVGINLSSYFSGELLVPDKEIMSGWLKFFSKLISTLENSKEYKVIFIMTSSTNEIIADEISKIVARPIQKYGPGSYNYKEIRHLISQLDLYLSMRMHGAIFAFSAGVPCIGLCFADKLKHFYSDYSLGEYRIDIGPTDYIADNLLKRLLDSIHNCIDVPIPKKELLKAKMESCRTKQSELFDLINEVLQ
jgi:polysaccharide pyruvyl transferase WcaK-like protein